MNKVACFDPESAKGQSGECHNFNQAKTRLSYLFKFTLNLKS